VPIFDPHLSTPSETPEGKTRWKKKTLRRRESSRGGVRKPQPRSSVPINVSGRYPCVEEELREASENAKYCKPD